MWCPIFQITFFISVSSFISVGAGDTVSACVPDTYNNDTSGICRDVFYYLSQTNHANCDRVCGVHGMNCTAVNHGFNDSTVLQIFAKILGYTCKRSYDAYKETGPAYYNQTSGEPFCTKWKNIPAKINCKSKPSYKRMLRLCPCVEQLLPTSNSIDQFARTTATDQSPRPKAIDRDQSPRPTVMYNDTTTGPGHSRSASFVQSKKDFYLLIISFTFFPFFQFY